MAEDENAAQPPRADPLCLASVTQPFPRSPKLLRKPDADSLKYSQEQFSCWLEELEKESKRTEAHMASLKKRQANLTLPPARMKASQVSSETRDASRLDLFKLLLTQCHMLRGICYTPT
ncbi:uncharacterized protein si:dkey-219e21.4 isoform X3 [Neoarius graeffei]|uniref:uncharacterized protein si:dkey-219e21.4 isoform X3 n=1 Tax=Neoarius graeffei TaxID=443677 RepID=UPI00298BFD19|nr:uncharacterized protein si:dkey-219e21.4 isoform X3 [Neoarius graeffei]